MADSPLTSGHENLILMVQKIYDHGKKTGDWLAFRAVEALVAEAAEAARKLQPLEQTKKNLDAITRNMKAQYRAINAQQRRGKTAKKQPVTKRPTGGTYGR